MDEIILSFLVNIVSSFIFLFAVLYLLRPKLAVATKICKQEMCIPGESEPSYLFKIVNRSYFDAFDVHLELLQLTQVKVTSKGINERGKPLPMKRNEIKHIPPFMSTAKCEERSYARHAILFRTHENLERILNDENQTLQLRIILRHGLTGLSRLYKTDYINKYDIEEGEFEFGNSLEIKKK
jgi:hypothetical protein